MSFETVTVSPRARPEQNPFASDLSERPARAGGGSRAAWAAIVFGLLALASIPVGTVVAGRIVSVDLARATGYAVVACFVFGLAGVSAVRRARYRNERSLYPSGRRTLRIGRFLVYAGLYVGLIGMIALAFYGVVLASS